MKGEVKTPVLVAVVVVAVAIAGLLLFKVTGGGDLDNGQVKYTPGVPPWMDKQNGASQPSGVGNGQPAAPSNMPPGMSAPSVGGNGK